ncbi:unnamed protein product [Gadus morhua 'NCC']
MGTTVGTRGHNGNHSGNQGPQWEPGATMGTTVGTRGHNGNQGPQWEPGATRGTQWEAGANGNQGPGATLGTTVGTRGHNGNHSGNQGPKGEAGPRLRCLSGLLGAERHRGSGRTVGGASLPYRPISGPNIRSVPTLIGRLREKNRPSYARTLGSSGRPTEMIAKQVKAT